MQEFGQLLLMVTFFVTLVTALTAIAGALTRNAAMMRASRYGVYAATALYVAMAIILTHGFLTHDFDNKYISAYSDRSMPTMYLLAAFWGGEKGALLFWTTSLVIFSAIAVYINRDKDPVYMAWVAAILMLAIFFFDLLMVFESSPFETFLTSAGPRDGKGLNPLLQNPVMAFHPPSLLTGYITFTLPFAFGMAALITGKLDAEWITDTRKWTLVSFVFLTIGLVLGMLWAYEEIGWGFWWMWDPVENAGLIPWFTATAFLHSVMIQERRGMFKRWNLILVCLTFLLTIFGTFLTRSQLIDSIHAFADSTLAEYFLWYMLVIIIVCTALISWRWKDLKGEARIESFWSREAFFVLNNVFLLFCAFIVLWGTLITKITESGTVRSLLDIPQPISWREEDFNEVMVPIGLFLLVLMSAGPLISWRRATVSNFKKNFMIPLAGSLLITVIGTAVAIVSAAGDKAEEIGGTFGEGYSAWADTLVLEHAYIFIAYMFCIFTAWTIGREFHRGARIRQRKSDESYLSALIALTVKAPRRHGGYLIHIGVVFMFIAFSGKFFKLELPERLMAEGDQLELGDYHLTFVKPEQFWDAENGYAASRATIAVLNEGETVAEREVEELAQWLASVQAGVFHIETKINSPKMLVRFKDETVRDRIRDDLYLADVFRKDFVPVVDNPAGRRMTFRVKDMGLIEVMPRLAMLKVRHAKTAMGPSSTVGAEVRGKGGSPEIDVLFATPQGYAAFKQRLESAAMPEHLAAAIFDPDTGAIEFIDSRTGTTRTPEVRFYAKHQTPTTEASITSSIYQDLYLAIQPRMEMGGVVGALSQPFINLLPVVFPLVTFLWTGSFLLVLGVLICLIPRWLARAIIAMTRFRRFGAPKPAAAVGLVALLAAGAVLAATLPARAGPGQGGLPPMRGFAPPPGDATDDVLSVLLCECGVGDARTIRHDTLADASCDCPTAVADRDVVRALVTKRSLAKQRSGAAKLEVLFELVEDVNPRWDERLKYDDATYKSLRGTTVTTCAGERGLLLSQAQIGCSVRRYWFPRWRVMLTAGIAKEAAFKYYVDVENIRQAPPTPWNYDDLRGKADLPLTWMIPVAAVVGILIGFVMFTMRQAKRRRAILAAGGDANAATEGSREAAGRDASGLSLEQRLRLEDELDVYET